MEIHANLCEQTATESEPVVPVRVEEEARREEPVVDTTLEKQGEWEKEREKLKDELVV